MGICSCKAYIFCINYIRNNFSYIDDLHAECSRKRFFNLAVVWWFHFSIECIAVIRNLLIVERLRRQIKHNGLSGTMLFPRRGLCMNRLKGGWGVARTGHVLWMSLQKTRCFIKDVWAETQGNSFYCSEMLTKSVSQCCAQILKVGGAKSCPKNLEELLALLRHQFGTRGWTEMGDQCLLCRNEPRSKHKVIFPWWLSINQKLYFHFGKLFAQNFKIFLLNG